MCSKIKFYERVGKSALFSCPEGGGHLYPVSDAFLLAVKLGTVYAGEMGISPFCDIDRYTLEEAVEK